ncbi:MAG: sensor histidine kinase [Pirellula sp.]
MTHNLEPTLPRAIQALLFASLHLRELSDHSSEADSELEDWFIQFAPHLGFAFSPTQSLLERFQAILMRIHSPYQSDNTSFLFQHADHRDIQSLVAAVHCAIKAISHRQRFVEAVQNEQHRSIYDFAYGLTHEINNPLANIAARAHQLLKGASSEPDRKSLATIVDQAMRAHDMLAEMMRVVKPAPLELGTICVEEIVNQAINSVSNKLVSNEIQLQLHRTSDSLFAISNAESFLEVLHGILCNCMDACRPSDRIDIAIDRLTVEDPDYGPGEENGTRVRIAIRDTGAGLSPESLHRAFHLYYSGREHGRGLGISLANAKRVIDASGGSIQIQSSPSLGTTVEIRLVATPPPVVTRRKIRVSNSPMK